MDTTARTALALRGTFDLGQSLAFGFGQRDAQRPGATEGPVMRLGFVLDGYRQQVGVAVRQVAPDELELGVTGSEDVEAVARHAARVLSVDVDARGWDDLGTRDALVGRLQAARPGLRPPLFHSAYEALSWSVLSARRPHRQMAALRDRIAATCGAVVPVAGLGVPVWPTPDQLLAVGDVPGLPEVKLRRLHGVAGAARDGTLDTAALRAVPPPDAAARLRQLEGIGPFYAELVVVRALGHTDVLPTSEPTVLQVAGELLDAGGPLTRAQLEERALGWSPWRTWGAVALRAAGPDLLTAPVLPAPAG